MKSPPGTEVLALRPEHDGSGVGVVVDVLEGGSDRGHQLVVEEVVGRAVDRDGGDIVVVDVDRHVLIGRMTSHGRILGQPA